MRKFHQSKMVSSRWIRKTDRHISSNTFNNSIWNQEVRQLWNSHRCKFSHVQQTLTDLHLQIWWWWASETRHKAAVVLWYLWRVWSTWHRWLSDPVLWCTRRPRDSVPWQQKRGETVLWHLWRYVVWRNFDCCPALACKLKCGFTLLPAIVASLRCFFPFFKAN